MNHQNFTGSHIDVLLSCAELGGKEWQFIGFYGEPRREHRKDSWYKLRFLRAQLDVPWLCMGDFNDVLAANEHIGDIDREE